MTAPRRASSCWRGARSAACRNYFTAAELPRHRRAALERARRARHGVGGDHQGRGRRRAADDGRQGQRPGQRAGHGAAQGAHAGLPRARGHPPHRLQGAHPDAAGRHRGGDAGDDRERATTDGERWSTVGVSTNIIDASYNALHDSLTYKLFRAGAAPSVAMACSVDCIAAHSPHRHSARKRESSGRTILAWPRFRGDDALGLGCVADGRHRPSPRARRGRARRSSWSSRSSARISARRRAPCSIAA